MRAFLPALLLAAAIPLTGCGDAERVAHPGGDSVMIRIVQTAGYGPDTDAADPPPELEVLGDGTVSGWRDDGSTFAFHASEAELQTLLRRAGDARLLATPPDYTPWTPVYDAGDTEVLLVAGDGHYDHVANALGLIDEREGPRARLLSFVRTTVAWARGHAS